MFAEVFSALNTNFVIKRGIIRIRIRFLVVFSDISLKNIRYCLNKIIPQNVTSFLFMCNFHLFSLQSRT